MDVKVVVARWDALAGETSEGLEDRAMVAAKTRLIRSLLQLVCSQLASLYQLRAGLLLDRLAGAVLWQLQTVLTACHATRAHYTVIGATNTTLTVFLRLNVVTRERSAFPSHISRHRRFGSWDPQEDDTMQPGPSGHRAREHSSMDEQDGSLNDLPSAKRSRRNWTRGAAACTRCVSILYIYASLLTLGHV